MNTANERERSDVEELLPWHAAGTLNRREARRVEAALANDPELARRYELVREELAQTIELNETLGAPSARAMQTLFAKIDAEPARRSASSINLGARIRDFFANRSPRMLAWSAVAAAFAILLQAGLLAGLVLKDRAPGGSYETASAPSIYAGQSEYAVIAFKPQASAADITRFLQTNTLSIATGPIAGGLYRVRIAAAKLSEAELARIVSTLRDDKVVGFIAPAQ